MKRKIKSILLCLVLMIAFSAIPVLAYSGTNENAQDYSRWTVPMESFLEECSDGTLMRVQYGSSFGVIAQYYDASYQLLKTVEIPEELPVFGGFYSNGTYYYLVTGQTNYNESADVEVYRITKYDTSWNRLGSVGLYDCNTTVPFDAGSCRMDSEGKYLVIHTSHEMYQTSDGYNHQANVTIQVDTETMTITDSFTKVMNK